MAQSDYTFGDKTTIMPGAMREWQQAIYRGAGMNAEDALVVADHLVTCDMRGVYSHGIMRTPIYVRRFEEKGTDPTARPVVARRKGATALVDGKNAMGMVAAAFATELAIEFAREFGCGAVSVTNSNHLGACAYYSEMATRANMVGFCWTINCGNIMAPWGGTERQLGNNPFAIGVPCASRPPVVLDMATSVVARGKIVMAMKTESKIPDTWALDVDGRPTTDAEAAYWGTVQPSGGYKGYGLTAMNAFISAVLSDSAFGDEVSDLYEKPDVRQNTGHLIQVIDIGAVNDADHFKRRMDDAVAYLKNGKRAEGVEEILVPGEPEARAHDRAEAGGIVYPVEVIEENRAVAAKYGVPPL